MKYLSNTQTDPFDMNVAEFICFPARLQSYPRQQRALACNTAPLDFTSRPLCTDLFFLLLPRPRLWGQMYVLCTLRNKRYFNHTIIELSRLGKTFKIIDSSQVCGCCPWTPKLLVVWKKPSQTQLCTLYIASSAKIKAGLSHPLALHLMCGFL